MIKKIISFLLPWGIRRWYLNKFFGYEIAPSARIGMAWIFPKKLVMHAGARIDHFTIAIHLDLIEMKENAIIGRSNWITGFSTLTQSSHFTHQRDRRAELYMGEESAVTKKHHLDCTNRIEIGKFSTVAGYDSQLLTHSIDVMENRQSSSPIKIGEYTFVGTNSVVLGGAELPSHCVLGAKSLLNKEYKDQWKLYGGVPAKAISDIPKDAKYFNRKSGFVY